MPTLRIWRGAPTTDGYGVATVAPRTIRKAHRAVYEMLVGPIPDGLQLDHLCRVRNCVNPAHLEPVTNAENCRRGEPANRTHCPHGHPYDEANTRRSRGRRMCRQCDRDWYWRNRDAVLARRRARQEGEDR